MSPHRALSRRFGHLFCAHLPRAPGFSYAPYRRDRKFRQQNHAAVGVHKELDPITGLQPKMLTNWLWDRGLSLDGNCRFHAVSHYFIQIVIPQFSPVNTAFPVSPLRTVFQLIAGESRASYPPE